MDDPEPNALIRWPRFRRHARWCCILTCALANLGLVLLLTGAGAWAAPKADPWPRWKAHDPASTWRIDHGAWGTFLRRYSLTDAPDGIFRMAYSKVTQADREALATYLETLQDTPVSALNRTEQAALWINLYNALTVQVVLMHYPVDSIRDIDISPGWFTNGPWDAALIRIEGQALTLNDIEHRILRPLWGDPRVHYAVSCASLGCPNLQPRPFDAMRLDAQLDAAARAFINNRRGARIEGGKLIVSSIYAWYQEDFGGSAQGVIEHLLRYAAPPLEGPLRAYEGGLDDDYDWSINDAKDK